MNPLRTISVAIALIFALLLGSSGVSFALPPCPSGQNQYYDNCFGSSEMENGRYVGEWRNNSPSGHGTYTYYNGDKYVGGHRNGVKHGIGTYYWETGEFSGDKYVGEWRNGDRHGWGTYTYPRLGEEYEGEWRSGNKHGQGTNFYGDGAKYVGEWRDNKRHGQGTYTFADGSKHVGEFRDHKRHGQGTYTDANGRVEEGIWKGGKFQYAQKVTPPEPPSDRRSPPTKSAPDNTKLVLVGAGSSFVISKNGHLLTNQHVVDGCQIVTIHLPSGLKKALVVATDDTNDLALLKTDLEDDNFVPISGTNVSLLEDVVVAGYPLSGSLSTTVKVTKGVVSSLAGLGNDYSQIQIDAAIQPGNSGGPILNDQGNVVAVTVAALNKEFFLKEQGTIPENTNFGIKSSTARAFVDANGVKLPQPYSRTMSRRDMADLITKTTHLVGCWVSRATAQQMASDQKQELSVTPTMQRQVEALR